MDTNIFPQSKGYELSLLEKLPDCKPLQEYLAPLIQKALDRFELGPAEHERLTKALLKDVKVAGERFLRNSRADDDSKFSAYFTWYIAERLKKERKK